MCVQDAWLAGAFVGVQVMRVLVLLDEGEAAARQEGRRRPIPGHVVAEILVGGPFCMVS